MASQCGASSTLIRKARIEIEKMKRKTNAKNADSAYARGADLSQFPSLRWLQSYAPPETDETDAERWAREDAEDDADGFTDTTSRIRRAFAQP
jgi:hypothetical protein